LSRGSTRETLERPTPARRQERALSQDDHSVAWHDLSMEGDPSDYAVGGGYRLDQLGWLQFERLASLVLEAEAGLPDLD
jgi:hypothetical protein